MKKFFERHDLAKIAGIVSLIAILLTWLCSYAYYSNGLLVTNEITRVGLFDIATYGFLGFYYFPTMFMFIFVVAGFYKLLNNIEAYKQVVTNIANAFNNETNKKLFVGISMFICAVLAGIVNEYFILIAFIPFLIAILSRLNVDRITGLSATFGGVLIGILGSTYSAKVAGIIANNVTGKYGYELLAVIFLFVISYILLLCLTLFRMNNNKKAKDVKLLEDPFRNETEEAISAKTSKRKTVKKGEIVNKVNVGPLVAVLIVTAIILILAFISWEEAFNVTFFTNIFDKVVNAELFGVNVFAYILGYNPATSTGSFTQFGTWDLFGGICVILLAILVLKLIYRITLDKIIDSFGEGFKAISKAIIVLFIVYITLQISVVFPTVPGLVEKIIGLSESLPSFVPDFIVKIFTNILMFISGALTGVFAVEMDYIARLIGSFYATFTNVNAAGLALQTSYGVVSFIAPTSGILMLGLAMLNIRFSEWVKHIWPFVLGITLVSMIILTIVTFI